MCPQRGSTQSKNKLICWHFFVNETSLNRLASHYKVVEGVEIYKMRYSKVKSDVVKYAKISQQIWPFLTFTHFGVMKIGFKMRRRWPSQLTKNQKSTHISKTFLPTTPLSTHQSIDLLLPYNLVMGVEVNG